MDFISGILGGLVAALLIQMFAEVLILTPGYFIYCVLFTKAEYDPDHKYGVDVSDTRVLVTGIIFWLVVIGGAYGIYRIAM